MGDLFLKILNMSIAASWLILAVVLLRLVVKKAPKWIAVLLWGIVAVRLVVPFSFESTLSLIPSAETFNAHNIQYETPSINSGIPAINNAVNPVLGETFAPNPAASVNPLYVWTFIVSVIWLIGIAAMLLYAVITYVRVRRSVAERAPYEGNIFLCDHVKSPFILGLVRPKIYLPSSMDAVSMEPVIAHEKAHLTRRDHWWKPLGFLVLTVHWFNPLCWVAYVLLCRDIELACDEKVIRQMDLDGKKHYSTALLECSTQRRLVTICPLAFGEVGVKERVKNVLNYKKPAFWVIAVAVVAYAVVTVCFATNPKQDSFGLRIVVPAGSQEPVVYADEEVSPLGNYIIVASGDGLGDTEVSLKPVEVRTETAYDEPTYLTPGMPVKLEAEKGGWFKIGVNVQNNTDEDKVVYVEVKNVNVRISAAVSSDQSTIDGLRVKYPEYFELGTFKGLEVYVWQMAENDYRFGLMQGTNREKTLEELMALKGASAAEMALILSTYEIEDENIFVILWGNPASSYLVTEDMVKDPEYINNIRTMLGLDGVSMGSGGEEDTPTTVGPDAADTTISEEQAAIRQAILKHNRSADPTGLVSCASFAELACVVVDGSDFSEYIHYGWALYEEYRVTDNGLKTVRGSHIPVVITLREDPSGTLTLEEYWEPKDGSYYAQDIREKFPTHIVDDGLNSQKFILQQTQECYAQAIASTGLDTNKVIGSLIETICSGPALSSNPGDYIKEHPIEYRELTYYGRYTLKYCFAEFLNGGQTDLRGHIMRAVLDDLAPEAQLNYDAETGQEYFDAWKDAAIFVGKQHDMEWIETHQPAIYLLLSMLGEV